MSNYKIRTERSADISYYVVDIPEGATLDDIALQVIEDDRPEFLLPIQLQEENGQRSFRYNMAAGKALEYFHNEMRKSEFLDFAMRLLSPFVKCKNWFLDYHHLCIDKSFIINDRKGNFVFLYLPADCMYNSDEKVIAFIVDCFNHVHINDDPKFQVDLMEYLRDTPIQFSELYRMFSEEKSRFSAHESQQRHNDTFSHDDHGGYGSGAQGGYSSEHNTGFASYSSQSGSAVQSIQTTENPSSFGESDNGGKGNEEELAKPKKGLFSGFFGGGKDKKQKDSKDAKDFASALLDQMDEDGTLGSQLLGGDSSRKSAHVESSEPAAVTPPQSLHQSHKSSAYQSPVASGYPTKPMGKNETRFDPSRMAAPSVPAPGLTGDETMAGDMIWDPNDATSINPASVREKFLELIDSRSPVAPPKRIELVFRKHTLTLGRMSGADSSFVPEIVFPEKSGVSRQHLLFDKQGNRLVVVDLGSKYGTLLDGQKLFPNMEYELHDGMILTLVEAQPIRYRVHLPE